MIQSKDLVIKNKVLIHISGRPSLAERKIFNVLLAHCFNDLADVKKPYFTIPVQQLIKDSGFTNNLNYKQFRTTCKNLAQCVVEWDILDTDAETEDFGMASLLASVKVSKGMIRYEIPFGLREILVDNKQYIKINLQIQRLFVSKYSLILYELSKEYYREKHKVGETPWISLVNIRELCGLLDREYTEFKEFNRKVLTVAINEINKKTDLQIAIEYKKEGRNVSAIKINIKPHSTNKQFGENLNNLPPQDEATDTPETQALLASLVSMGLTHEKSLEYIASKGVDYVQQKLDLAIEYLTQGKIKTSIGGFIIRSIEEDYGTKVDMQKALEIEGLESRKKQPETVVVYPLEFDSETAFNQHLEAMEQAFYSPKYILSELDLARTKWSASYKTA